MGRKRRKQRAKQQQQKKRQISTGTNDKIKGREASVGGENFA